MDIHAELTSLKPRRKGLIFDLARELGFDVADWIASASVPNKIKSNPKYCYDWAFVQPGVVAIFNLWHGAMRVSDGRIVYTDNFRENAEFHRLNGGKRQWVTRGRQLDLAVAAAVKGNLPVRVIVVDGQRRATEDPNSESSTVSHRQIDPVEWHVDHYSPEGAVMLVRGPRPPHFVDQFDVSEPEEGPPTKRDATGSRYDRDPRVRDQAKRRAAGFCEYCGEAGFKMANGSIYLETHHIIQLCDGGLDNSRNVIALCPNDHRRAHFGENRDAMRDRMLESLKG